MSCTTCAKGADGKPAGCRSNGFCASSGCNKLDVFDWLAGVPVPGGQPSFDAVEVRFKNTRKAFYRNAAGHPLMAGDLVTVEASPGHDVGMVSLAGELVRAQMQRKDQGTDTYQLRKVLHKSSQEEIDTWHAARKLEDETMFAARAICREMGLDMKVSDVEYQGDGKRATFYYTSEQRVDFRDLLPRLNKRFGVRTGLKQIGARQEAARIGGIGSCGRELCCSTWLTDLRSVTTSAARYQQLALNPQKLAGQCGKLKCCLNYELDMYIEAIKSYPSRNAKLKTKQGTGTHIKTDIFTGRIWYVFKRPGEAPAMAGLPVDTVRDILARNKEGIEPEVDLHAAQEQAPPEVGTVSTDYENVIDGAEDLSRFDNKVKPGKKHARGGKKRTGTDGGARSEQRRKDGGRASKESTAGHGPRKEGGAREPDPGRPAGERRGRDRSDRRRKGTRPNGPPQGGGGNTPPAA